MMQEKKNFKYISQRNEKNTSIHETPGTMKLLETTKIKITKYENGENVPHLEITEVLLGHCNIVQQ